MLIDIRNVQKKYYMGKNTVNALSDISFTVESGEFVAIVGASGSGKSTLMNILGCLDTPTDGSYLLDEADVSALGDNRLSEIRNSKIGFIFQGFNLIPSLTAFENVELPLVYRKVLKNKRKLLADEALEQVKLSGRALHRPSEMSGGQQQRIAIARAIASSPPIILADEPCGNLDSRSGKEVMSILHSLNKLGKTIILITHDEAAAKTAHRLIRISDGRIVS